MYGIFMECVVIFKLYTGLRYLAVLYLIAFLYLLIREKEKRIRIMLLYTPLVILALFFCPLFRKFFVAAGLDGETYYRILWLLPMGITIAYAGCRLFAGHKRIGLAVMSAAVILCGTWVYSNPNISKAENLYHIPDPVVGVCDFLKAEEGKNYIKAVFPQEMVHFVRQYDTDIMMPYGRDMLVPRWDYYNEVHEAMEKATIVDIAVLLKATREYGCNYIILHESREVKEDPTMQDLEFLGNVEGYLIYRDPVMMEKLAENG